MPSSLPSLISPSPPAQFDSQRHREQEMVKADPSKPQETFLTAFLELASMYLILMTSLLGLAAQYEAVKRTAADSGNFSQRALMSRSLRNSRCCGCGPRRAGLLDYVESLPGENGDPFIDVDELFNGSEADDAVYAKLDADFEASNPLSLSLTEWLHSVNLGHFEAAVVKYITDELNDPVDVMTIACLDQESAAKMAQSLNLDVATELPVFEEAFSVLRALILDSMRRGKGDNPLHQELGEWLQTLEPPLGQYEETLAALLSEADKSLQVLALARSKRSEVETMRALFGNESQEAAAFQTGCKKLRSFLRKGFRKNEEYIQQGQIETVGTARVNVEVLQCRNLVQHHQWAGGAEPYVVVKLMDEEQKTHPSNVSSNPSFADPESKGTGFHFESPFITSSSSLEVTVYSDTILDKLTNDDVLGVVKIRVGDLPHMYSADSPKWYKLQAPQDSDGKPELDRGEVQLNCHARLPKDLHTLVMMMHNHMDESQVSLDVHVQLRPMMSWWIRMVNKHGSHPWAGGLAGEHVAKQLDLCNIKQLRLLLKFEQHHKNRRALVDSLKTRMLVDKITQHPAVFKLTENIVAAKRDALAVRTHAFTRRIHSTHYPPHSVLKLPLPTNLRSK
jgi:hypothetical protein